MRKFITILLLICMLMTLGGCDPAQIYFNFENLIVESVELICYENDDARKIYDNIAFVKPFDFSRVTILATLDEDKINDFSHDLSKIPFLNWWWILDSPTGKCIRINYVDGRFDIICCEVQFTCVYNADGTARYVLGDGGIIVEGLVENYFVK